MYEVTSDIANCESFRQICLLETWRSRVFVLLERCFPDMTIVENARAPSSGFMRQIRCYYACRKLFVYMIDGRKVPRSSIDSRIDVQKMYYQFGLFFSNDSSVVAGIVSVPVWSPLYHNSRNSL
jgi:hypothetical protein